MEVKAGYKRTEVGVIPEDWDLFAVRQMGEVVTGKALAIRGRGKQRPYLRTKNVFDGRIGIEDVLTMPMTDEQFAQFRVQHGDVLLNEGQSIELVGRCSMYSDEYPEPCAIQNQLIRFRARLGVSPVFASYLFRNCQATGEFQRIALRTTSIAHLGGSRFERLRLAWPKMEREQRAIAEALSDVDRLLGGLDRLIAKKRDLKQAAMQQLLTGQTRLPGFKGEWEEITLGALGTFLKGAAVRKDHALSGSLACVRYGELYTHHKDLIRVFSSWISPSVALTATRLVKGDILFAGSGETKEEIGKCAAFISDIEAYAGGDIIILRPREANPVFLGYFLNTTPINQQKASRGQGDAVVHISRSALSAIRCRIPKPPEQTSIGAALTEMDAELSALERRRDKTRALKQAMMQELLTGKTRLVAKEPAYA